MTKKYEAKVIGQIITNLEILILDDLFEIISEDFESQVELYKIKLVKTQECEHRYIRGRATFSSSSEGVLVGTRVECADCFVKVFPSNELEQKFSTYTAT